MKTGFWIALVASHVTEPVWLLLNRVWFIAYMYGAAAEMTELNYSTRSGSSEPGSVLILTTRHLKMHAVNYSNDAGKLATSGAQNI